MRRRGEPPGWRPRGLAFNEDKTRVAILGKGFDFLGFTVRRYGTKESGRDHELVGPPVSETSWNRTTAVSVPRRHSREPVAWPEVRLAAAPQR